MRWMHLTIVVLFAAATVIFAFQNFERVTVSFLGLSVGTRLAILILIVYVLGAVTGGSLLALLRRSWAPAFRHRNGCMIFPRTGIHAD